MAPEPLLLVEPAAVPLPKSPIVRVNSQPLPTDSMVSISLSDPIPDTIVEDDMETKSIDSDITVEPVRNSNPRRSSADIFGGVDLETEINGSSEDSKDESAVIDSPSEPDQNQVEAAAAALEGKPRSRRQTSNSISSDGSSEDDFPVDWEGLEKNEESEPRDEASDEVSGFSSLSGDYWLTECTANGVFTCPA